MRVNATRTVQDLTQADYDAAEAEIQRWYPGINDDGTCRHGTRYDRCPTCSPPEDAPTDTS